MLRFLGSAHKFCDGATRRDFLQIGAFGAGLSLADMLWLNTARAAGGAKKQPTRSKKSAIMIYLPGGPSHMDMYDLKPEAPAEFRGEFKPIPTNVPGVEICEHFPLQAKMWDKLACVRSIVSVDEHSDSLVLTGYPDRINRVADHPSFGSVVSKLRAAESGAVPPFVSLRGMSRGTEPGYLGIAHRPFTPGGPGNANLRLANGVTGDPLDERKNLLDKFDDTRREIDASGTMAGMDAYTEKALEMVTAGVVRDALDLRKEDPKVVELVQGRRTVPHGPAADRGRRRLRRTLSIGGWDTHGQNFQTLAASSRR